ncbi:hypothetical protein [Streptomyces cavernicola]|uniref:Uncharacterized protein n=1 Tax=Streptomyces cavernicola TaxID=3043613 RepID=A0ABT6SD89_9ACTN|nr:hypothetical protein [Streptomyces sp. B-S-A6]MDI3405909.1 hypothetical protein [Streptomyces sp. B-S-A6]
MFRNDSPAPIPRQKLRQLLLALTLCCALVAGGTACGAAPAKSGEDVKAAAVAEQTPKPTSSAKQQEKQKFAKTRFVANAGLAAGAAYQWIVKPARDGKFKKGAKGRKFTLIKAGLAGAFAYNRLKAAVKNAQGDPLLAKAVAPLAAGIESLKDLPSKLRKGNGAEDASGVFDSVINSVKDAGKDAGAPVKEKVPSLSELRGG